MNQYFFEAYEGLERLSPGSNASTLLATKSISRVSEVNILEIGCGTGTTGILLAKAFPKARIIAVDSHSEYIRVLGQRAAQEGVSQQVQGMVMDMNKLKFPAGQFDVILCEGAVNQMGFEKALKEWKKLLRPDGQLLVNDLCFLKAHVGSTCTKYWEKEYPEMKSKVSREKLGKSLGYDLISSTVQPASDWIEHYYKPLNENLEKMMEKYPEVSEVQELVLSIQTEMGMYARFASSYGYVMFQFKPN